MSKHTKRKPSSPSQSPERPRYVVVVVYLMIGLMLLSTLALFLSSQYVIPQ